MKMVEFKDQFLIKIVFLTNERSFFDNRSVMVHEVDPRKYQFLRLSRFLKRSCYSERMRKEKLS